jgi:hypothetical protein
MSLASSAAYCKVVSANTIPVLGKAEAMGSKTAAEELKSTTDVGDIVPLDRADTATGDEIDNAILRANGHDAVLQRQFRWLSALALAFSITNSWIGYLVREAAGKELDSADEALSEQFWPKSDLWRPGCGPVWPHHCLLCARHHLHRLG